MEDENRVLDQEYEDKQADNKRKSQSGEDIDAANENPDTDSNFKYNGEDTETSPPGDIQQPTPGSKGAPQYNSHSTYMLPLPPPLPSLYPDIDTTGVDVDGEHHVPQGEPSDFDSNEDDIPLIKRQKEKTAPDVGPSKRKRKDLTVTKMEKAWGVSLEEAREFSRLYNIYSSNQIFSRKDSNNIQEKLIAIVSMINQIESLNKFIIKMSKEKVAHENAISRLERSRFRYVLTCRSDHDAMVKVRCTNPKTERILTVYITRRGNKDEVVEQYNKVLSSYDLVKFRYIEWLQIVELVNKQREHMLRD
ncbi:unnamed protein product [Lactuca saligna]|uniref:Uncharacterized protein n=1 Tax=Lactuca saligna TaxID=75948 RepID=A0AA35VAP3_LACSI|nr:unnamed protein product [Lactuca saligna]